MGHKKSIWIIVLDLHLPFGEQLVIVGLRFFEFDSRGTLLRAFSSIHWITEEITPASWRISL